MWHCVMRPVVCWPGVADGGDGVAELAVNAAAVIELLVGVAWRALVLNAADPADAHDEDDEHQDEGHAQRSDDDVQGVAGHVGQGVVRVCRLPLQVWGKYRVFHTIQCRLTAGLCFSGQVDLRISQLGPTQPGGQWQVKPFDWSMQVPPWWQGLLSHSLMSTSHLSPEQTGKNGFKTLRRPDHKWDRLQPQRSPMYPGGQAQEALRPALSQRPPFWQRTFKHGSL